VQLEWKDQQVECVFVDVYAPYEDQGKRKLWEDILSFMRNSRVKLWCLLGDFNAVLSMNERKGINVWTRGSKIRDFCKFVADAEVEEIPLLGRGFTWYRIDGSVMSRIDKMLVS
jgi:hypothetical protein